MGLLWFQKVVMYSFRVLYALLDSGCCGCRVALFGLGGGFAVVAEWVCCVFLSYGLLCWFLPGFVLSLFQTWFVVVSEVGLLWLQIGFIGVSEWRCVVSELLGVVSEWVCVVS